MTNPPRARRVLGAMYVGLALAVVATIAPYVDRGTTHLLADHIRDGYPAYLQARVDSVVSTCLVALSVIGALGVLAWLTTAWAVQAGNRWARPAATAVFMLGTGIGLTGLLARDSSGTTGLPSELGWAGMIPCLAGVVAVALLWRRP